MLSCQVFNVDGETPQLAETSHLPFFTAQTLQVKSAGVWSHAPRIDTVQNRQKYLIRKNKIKKLNFNSNFPQANLV